MVIKGAAWVPAGRKIFTECIQNTVPGATLLFNRQAHSIRLFSADNERAGLNNSGLLPGNFLDGCPEIFGMVKGNRGKYGHLTIKDGCRIRTASHSGLHNSQLNSLFTENICCQSCCNLKKSRLIRGGLQNGIQFARQFLSGIFFTIYSEALCEMYQMRRAEQGN